MAELDGDEAKRALLRHFLATLAYRTQKALRDAPPDFAEFEAGNMVRSPAELVRHMTDVLGYARGLFRAGAYRADPPAPFRIEVRRFHHMLEDLSDHLRDGGRITELTLERLLQGPLSDAMTHAGQLALLRRLHGAPIPPENFAGAEVDATRLGEDQPPPRMPSTRWPEKL
jgi:hypothetical protein